VEAAAKALESPKAPAPAMKKAEAPKPAAAPPAAAPTGKPEPAATKMPAAEPKPITATPAPPPLAKQEAAAPKAAETDAKRGPGAAQPEAGKQAGTGGKVAANEPAALKTDIPSGIPTTPEAKPRRARANGKRATRPRPAAACRYAGRRVSPGNWYTVREGDSLWRIARRHLGGGENYRMLRAANRRAIADADLIRPCQRIFIPRRGARHRS
jgi:nucleoid-associated protein YgaU